MENKLNIKEIIKIGVILFLITAVSAALLAFVNGKTAPLIEKNSLAKEQSALKTVMPEAASFEETSIDCATDTGIDDSNKINKIYSAKSSGGETIGVCVITETTGYDVGIQTVTGVNADLEVTGIDIIAMNETPGLGAKAAEDSFKNQYSGKSGVIGVSKGTPSDTEIQAISGATKTSNGVTKGVNIALKIAEMIPMGGDSNGK